VPATNTCPAVGSGGRAAVESEFLDEFDADLSDEQLGFLTSPFRSGIPAVGLPDPDTVDPREEPEIALTILQSEPESLLEMGEKPFILPLMRYLEAAEQAPPPAVKVLSEQYDIYLVMYRLSAVPVGKDRFTSLALRVDYADDAGFVTYSLTPDTELEEKFAAHG
jgi:hypothetical protein